LLPPRTTGKAHPSLLATIERMSRFTARWSCSWPSSVAFSGTPWQRMAFHKARGCPLVTALCARDIDGLSCRIHRAIRSFSKWAPSKLTILALPRRSPRLTEGDQTSDSSRTTSCDRSLAALWSSSGHCGGEAASRHHDTSVAGPDRDHPTPAAGVPRASNRRSPQPLLPPLFAAPGAVARRGWGGGAVDRL
jgi:hypothetical protein